MPDPDQKIRVKSRDEFDAFRRLVDGFLEPSKRASRGRNDAWAPPMDVYETESDVVMKVSLPGVCACNIEVKFEGKTITIRGYRAAAHEPDIVAYHQMEIRSGRFERRVIIRKPLDPKKATAEYEDGFLMIRIPKISKAVTRAYSFKIRL
ncbi:MAG: Hsp20/alpha crystallin family protein [Candidatus Brocadiia bacterium]